MPKPLIRLVAFLLVPCLVGDLLQAAPTNLAARQTPTANFQTEALSIILGSFPYSRLDAKATITEDQWLSQAGFPQMGKHVHVISVIERDGKKYLIAQRLENPWENPTEIELESAHEISLTSLLSSLFDPELISPDHEILVKTLVDTILQAPISFYTFSSTLDDLLGYASEEEKLLAVHKVLSEDAMAWFHEGCEYLHEAGLLQLSFKENILKIDVAGKLPFQIALGKESRGLIKADTFHYYLRALQRELFGTLDLVFSSKIWQMVSLHARHAQPRPKVIFMQAPSVEPPHVIALADQEKMFLVTLVSLVADSIKKKATFHVEYKDEKYRMTFTQKPWSKDRLEDLDNIARLMGTPRTDTIGSDRAHHYSFVLPEGFLEAAFDLSDQEVADNDLHLFAGEVKNAVDRQGGPPKGPSGRDYTSQSGTYPPIRTFGEHERWIDERLIKPSHDPSQANWIESILITPENPVINLMVNFLMVLPLSPEVFQSFEKLAKGEWPRKDKWQRDPSGFYRTLIKDPSRLRDPGRPYPDAHASDRGSHRFTTRIAKTENEFIEEAAIFLHEFGAFWSLDEETNLALETLFRLWVKKYLPFDLNNPGDWKGKLNREFQKRRRSRSIRGPIAYRRLLRGLVKINNLGERPRDLLTELSKEEIVFDAKELLIESLANRMIPVLPPDDLNRALYSYLKNLKAGKKMTRKEEIFRALLKPHFVSSIPLLHGGGWTDSSSIIERRLFQRTFHRLEGESVKIHLPRDYTRERDSQDLASAA